ncbi:MAG: hypothetical protein ACPG7F_08150 [Aggregatilineales bacterium]
MRRIDKSKFLINLLSGISHTWAKYPGLPIMGGIGLVIIAFITQLINISTDSVLLEYVYVIFHNTGILLSLIGLLMMDPLGK